MGAHFSRIAARYGDLRTTDEAPVRHIRDALAGCRQVRAADVGCGEGRYDLLLFRHLPGLHLTCIDANPDMLAQLSARLRDAGIADFEAVVARAEEIDLPAGGLDCIVSFNAVQHFDVPVFLAAAGAALRPGGRLFIYTRTPEQNAASVWGQCFPGFCEKEARLYTRARMGRWVAAAAGLDLGAAATFRYRRQASLAELIERARGRHYSTFALYGADEFEAAIAGFEAAVRARFPDPDEVRWQDANIMYDIVRRPSAAEATPQ